MSVKIKILMAGLLGIAAWTSAATVRVAMAQPRFGPPDRVSAEAAGRAIGGPTQVTLHSKDVPPLEVFQSLVKQAGLSLADDAAAVVDGRPRISVDFEKQPFWVVVRALATKLDLGFSIGPSPDFRNSARGWVLSLSAGRDASLHGPAQMHGPFLVIASSVGRSMQLAEDGTQSAAAQRLTVEFTLLVDPKLRTRGRPAGREIEILDDRGGRLPAQESYGVWTQDVRSPSPLMWRFKAMANLPERGTPKLGKLQAVVRGFLATTTSATWEVPDILQAKDVWKNSGTGASFFVRGIVGQDEDRAAQYVLTVDSAGPGEETDFGWPPRSDDDRVSALHLLDSQGREFFPQSWHQDAEKFIVYFQPGQRAGPAAVGKPAKLLWELPTQVVEIEIPLEFVDVPIP